MVYWWDGIATRPWSGSLLQGGGRQGNKCLFSAFGQTNNYGADCNLETAAGFLTRCFLFASTSVRGCLLLGQVLDPATTGSDDPDRRTAPPLILVSLAHFLTPVPR